MPQFDVHRNTGRRTRDALPYLVILQSSLFADSRRRVIIPLARQTELRGDCDDRLHPIFVVEETRVVLQTLDLTNVLATDLGEVVASLRNEGDRIIAAVDWMMTRGYE